MGTARNAYTILERHVLGKLPHGIRWEDTIKIDFMQIGIKVDETATGSCSIASFFISGAEPPGSAVEALGSLSWICQRDSDLGSVI
jgi:hypothetical protein